MSDLNLDDLTQTEKQILLGTLLKQFVGAVPLEAPPFGLGLHIVSEEKIAPGIAKTLSNRPLFDCHFQRFVVLELQQSILEYEDREIRTKRRWRKDLVEHTRVPKSRVVTVPRSQWSILGAFVGNKLIYPSHAVINGGLFAPDGELGMDVSCQAALDMSITVRNDGEHPAKFYGVLLGNVGLHKNLKAV